MLLDKLLQPAEKILNRYLAADPEKAENLQVYAGKTIAVILLPWQQTFFIHILENHQLHLTTFFSTSPDLTITGTPLALLGLLRDDNSGVPKEIVISGDVHFAQQIKKILREIDIDWEEQLSHYVGDFWAVTILKPWRRLHRWQQHATHSLQRQLSEYLQEEAQHLPPRFALEEFYQHVDTLRDDVERLTTRIHLLHASDLC